MKRDFETLGRALLAQSEAILYGLFPSGKIKSREFTVGSLAGEPGKSLSINTDTGRWGDFATGVSGGDLISLYAAAKGIGNVEAFDQLSAMYGEVQAPTASYVRPKADAEPIKPPPGVSPPAIKGAEAIYEYKDIDGSTWMYIARYATSDGKAFYPHTFAGGTWQKKNWPGKRPLFGLEFLGESPDKAVLIVEGEKAALAARAVLGRLYNVITWPGGANAIEKVNWEPLHGKANVLIWPDNDEAGVAAAAKIAAWLVQKCGVVKMLKVRDSHLAPKADAHDYFVIEKRTLSEWKEWAKPLAVVIQKHEPKPKAIVPEVMPPPPARDYSQDEDTSPESTVIPPMSRSVHAFKLPYQRNGKDVAVANMSNCLVFVEAARQSEFDIWQDEFHGKLFISWGGAEGRPWEDHDILRATAIAQRNYNFPAASKELMKQAMLLAARSSIRNEPKTWLSSLKWDGTPRVGMFFTDYMGTTETDYISRAASNFWVAMVARIFQPGCKFDNMVVLFGDQGSRKSSALYAIGGKWFGEITETFGTKDFFQKLQGKILLEIPELESFKRSGFNAIKAILSQRDDEFRPPYGEGIVKYPRQSVFVGTTNEEEFLGDATGARRFWPVRIGSKIDVAGIERDRDQLFAEAVELYKQGHAWWEVPLSAKAEQDRHYDADVWTEMIESYLSLLDRDEVSVSDILCACLKIEPGRMTKAESMRATAVLKMLGWKRTQNIRSLNVKWTRPVPLFSGAPMTPGRAVKILQGDLTN